MGADTATPLVTLSSDFGLRDAYVAQMKGVLLSEGPPDLRLQDLSHEIARGDVIAAALFLEAAVPRFPPHTVHLVVVDPGVGSARRLLIAQLADGQCIVAPDNGLLSLLLAANADAELTAIDVAGLAGSRTVSPTFHGRDLLAPIAARLARGMRPRSLGVHITDPVRLDLPTARAGSGRVFGHVLHVDHFGNLITNVSAEMFPPMPPGRTLLARIGSTNIGPLRTHYAEVAQAELLLLWGSSGRLEIAVRDGSAAARLQAERHAELTIEVVDVVEKDR